ncbi:MAG: hypothetical protein EAZ13_04220 [Sphingobacteriia bacterium]|nr:MAG: hypothetical protein EAZ13_04220 [Sphingobacteriia bacterium]
MSHQKSHSKKVKLSAVTHAGKGVGTLGEFPWRDNRCNISCIPEGVYKLHVRVSKKHHLHLQVYRVLARCYILITPPFFKRLHNEGIILMAISTAIISAPLKRVERAK